MRVHRRMAIADLGESRGHGAEREVGRIAGGDLVPVERRRDPRVRFRPHRIGAGNRAVLRVLVVVEEDAVTLFLPPLAGGQRRRSPFDFACQRQRRSRAPGRRSSGARSARRCESRASRRSWASRPGPGRRGWRAPRPPPREPAPTPRPGPDRDPRAARPDDRDRPRAPDAGAFRDRPDSPSTPVPQRHEAQPLPRCGRTGISAAPPRSSRAATAAPASGRRSLRQCRSGSAPGHWAGSLRPAARHRQPPGSSARDPAWCNRPAGTGLCLDWSARPPGRRRSALPVRQARPSPDYKGSRRGKAKGRRQKAEGKRQKNGSRQPATGRRSSRGPVPGVRCPGTQNLRTQNPRTQNPRTQSLKGKRQKAEGK